MNRRHLLSIGRVISKTVVYGALAVFVTVSYLAAALGLQAAAGRWGESSLVFSILSTAFVAVMFQPVRLRLQRIANQLVYGKRASPYEALAALSRRMREPVAAATLLPTMARAVTEGTGAIQAAVWLASGAELRPAAVWPEQRTQNQRLRMVDVCPPLGAYVARTVPIHDGGLLRGALTVTKPMNEQITPAEDKLLSDLAGQAGLAMRNARLVEDLKASRQRIVAAQDAGRRRLERDIHDGAQQRLITLSLAFRLAGSHPGLTSSQAAALETAAQVLQHCLIELRELARGVHPVLLTEEGLGPALSSLAERSPIATKLASAPVERLPSHVEATAHQIISQSLSTAAQAGATSATISVQHIDGQLILEISDDAAHATSQRLAEFACLDDRVTALDGRIELHAMAGRGVVVKAVIPCESC